MAVDDSRRVIELQISNLQKDLNDLENDNDKEHDEFDKRLKPVEEMKIRLDFIVWLVLGGGLLNVLQLFGMIATIGLILYGKPAP